MIDTGRRASLVAAATPAAIGIAMLAGSTSTAAHNATRDQTAKTVATARSADYRARLPQDEVVYLIMPDRFENGDTANDHGRLSGDRLHTGYDPTSKYFYHGGDLEGVIKRLDYIQGLGATAIWLTPVFVNKPVQGDPGKEGAGYHGYWITDFTNVDPHLGTNRDYKRLVDAAHARGMKVYMDIVVNHTADVIQYEECARKPQGSCAYRSIADYPYQRRGGPNGAPANAGFTGEYDGSAANFARLTDPSYAYTPIVPDAEKHIKKPEWLNEPIYYHNRGDSTFRGESSQMGDFFGLDDLFTENPRVVSGMIEIYGKWIDDYGIDGFRVDTEQHVNPEFWRQFVPAMLARAKARGIPNFYIFGEAHTDDMDPAHTAVRTRVDGMSAMMDYPFQRAVVDTVAGNAPTDELAKLFDADPLYQGGAGAALQQATFIGNYDAGRIAYFIRKANPTASDGEVLKRVMLADAMLLTLRGVPVLYYGDEQGFAGRGGDADARQDMFPSKVASYNEDTLVGTNATTAQSNFNNARPLYREIARLTRVHTSHAALTGSLQTIRYSSEKPGLFAVSRFKPVSKGEMLLLFNTSAHSIEQNVRVETRSTRFTTIAGSCPAAEVAPGSVHVILPPFGYGVCDAD